MYYPLVIGNWKMNLTSKEASTLIQKIITQTKNQKNVEIVVCPSFVQLYQIHKLIMPTSIKIGSQDVFWENNGAFTGSVSSKMLLDCGVNYCLVGHSETRGRFGKSDLSQQLLNYFSETSQTIQLKIKTLLENYIHPVLCVGETLQERENQQTFSVIETQIQEALQNFEPRDLYDLVIAYEPVWAIGTGKTCEPKQAQEICHFIRQTLLNNFGPDVAQKIRILYGGSVKPENAHALFNQPDINGGLIGGASLNAQDFNQIIEIANNLRTNE